MAKENTAFGMSSTVPTAPPSYDAALQEAPPPSYQSLFGKIKSEKEKNSSPVRFVGSVFRILLHTFLATVLMAIILSIPITMIIIGAIYFKACPAEHLIPIYLIVMGAAYIGLILIELKGRYQRYRLPPEEQADFKPNKVACGISYLIGVFCFAFFIAGTVWIYRLYIYTPNTTDSSAADYCHPTLFYLALWVTNVWYIVAAFICICGCCFCYVFCDDSY